MPIHDWTRVDDRICRSFHLSWCVQLKRRLNNELLPSDFYAMLEPVMPPPVDGFIGPAIGERHQQADADEPILVGSDSPSALESVGWNVIVIRTDPEDKVVGVVQLPLPTDGTVPDWSIFLRSGEWVILPLEVTFRSAYSDLPPRWRRVIEGG